MTPRCARHTSDAKDSKHRHPVYAVEPALAALGVVVLASWVLWVGQTPARGTFHPFSVPQTLGLWTGKSLAVDQRTLEILETDDVTLMEYQMGQEPPVWFAQVAGFGHRAAFHPPELCYVGSHFEVLERQPVSVIVNGKPQRLMRLLIGQGKDRFEAWYWFSVNGRVTPNYYQQQLWLVGQNIRRQTASGTLVRISTPFTDARSTHRRLLAFVSSYEKYAGQPFTATDAS